MGFGPEQVDQWEPQQFRAVYLGWVRANSPPQAKAPSDDDFQKLVSRVVH